MNLTKLIKIIGDKVIIIKRIFERKKLNCKIYYFIFGYSIIDSTATTALLTFSFFFVSESFTLFGIENYTVFFNNLFRELAINFIYIISIFCTGFIVRNRIQLGHFLGFFFRYFSLIFHIIFISDENYTKIINIGGLFHILHPVIDSFKGFFISYIEGQYNTLDRAVVDGGYCSESFLSCCIPDLDKDILSSNLDLFLPIFYSQSSNKVIHEFILYKSHQE